MNSCNIDGSKVVFTIDGRTRHFTLDAGSEIVYYMMHYWSHDEIVEALSSYEQTQKLLQYLPGYQAKQIEHDKGVCPTCSRPL